MARWLIRRNDLAEPAAQLALLRIVVSLLFLTLPELHHAPARAASPVALRVVPEGLGWFVAAIPITPTIARIAQAVCVASALAAAAGLHARIALAALTFAGFYVCAISQLAGWVWHDMHLVWMTALLAASPCADALASDRGRVLGPADHVRYGVPLQFARGLLACVYLFPGVHKLARSGVAWALSDNLAYQLYWKWAEHGIASPIRIDRVPLALHAGGLFVLAFEITFVVVLFVPRLRLAYAGAGIAFHLLAWALFRIPFASLWGLYVVLLPGAWVHAIEARVVRAARDSSREASGATRVDLATSIVGAILVAGAFVQGARGQMRSFPFACYPTFEWRAGPELPDLVLEAERADGTRVEIPHARDVNGYRTQRQWGEIWSLAGVNDRVDPARLRAYYAAVLRGSRRARGAADGAVHVRAYRSYIDVVPEHRGRPPRRGREIAMLF